MFSPSFLPSPFLKQLLFDLVVGNQAHKNTNTQKKAEPKSKLHMMLQEIRGLFFPQFVTAVLLMNN